MTTNLEVQSGEPEPLPPALVASTPSVEVTVEDNGRSVSVSGDSRTILKVAAIAGIAAVALL